MCGGWEAEPPCLACVWPVFVTFACVFLQIQVCLGPQAILQLALPCQRCSVQVPHGVFHVFHGLCTAGVEQQPFGGGFLISYFSHSLLLAHMLEEPAQTCSSSTTPLQRRPQKILSDARPRFMCEVPNLGPHLYRPSTSSVA